MDLKVLFFQGKSHFVINFDVAFADVCELAFEESFFEWREFVGKQNSFDVIVFVLNNSRRHTFIIFGMRYKIFILVSDGQS